MKRIALQPRLRLLAEMTPPGGRLADIGTDHGYLPVWLLQEGRIPSAIASDVGAEPLEHARRTAAEYETQGLDFRLCDGLSGIEPEETDTVVIAGMGGETIRDILRAAPWAADGHHTLLLQPMTKVELLRGWLRENGYSCTEERLVQDKGKLYVILSVTGGPSGEASDAERYGGFCLEHDPLYGLYLEQQLRRLYLRMDGLHRGGDESEAEPLAALADILEGKKEAWQRVTVNDVTQMMFRWAPPELAMDWDNVGLLVGRGDREIHRVLVALDVSPDVAAEAAETGTDLIVSHHPVMNIRWHAQQMQTLREDTRLGGLLTELVKRDISAICMHTNLDAAEGGVNDCLACTLGLQDTKPLNEEKIGRIGTLSCEKPLEQFLSDVVKLLSCNGLRYRDGGRPVHRVAVGGGACGEYIPQAIAQGCDTFVTADLRYNDFLDTQGLNLIDAGHFPTEDVVCQEIVRRLRETFPELEVTKSAVHGDAVKFYMR